MQKMRRGGSLALLCYLGAATTTTTSFPTVVSGFRAPCAAAGRTRRRPAEEAKEALRPHYHRLQQEQQRASRALAESSTALGVGRAQQRQRKQQQQQQQQQQRRQQQQAGAWGRGWGLNSVEAGRTDSSGGGGGGLGRGGVARGGRARALFSRWLTGDSSSSSWLLRCTAGGDDDSNNYGSPDYSEYGYEPEYELQDEERMNTSDEETLKKWRLQRLLANDRWQFGMYGTQCVGNWIGSWQEYVAQEVAAGVEPESDIGSMVGIVPGRKFVAKTRISRRVVESAGGIKIFEHEQGPAAAGAGQGAVGYDPAACPQPVVGILFTDSFRGGNGTQVVGNTYTSAEVPLPAAATAAAGASREAAAASGTEAVAAAGSRDDLWVEIGLRARDKDVRMRCVFQYGPGRRGGSGNEEEGGSQGAPPAAESSAASSHSMVIRRVFLVREGLDRLPAQDATKEPELYGAAGRGLYDPSPLSRSPLYFSIYAEGGLTLRFPLEVEAGQGGVLSVDWTAGSSRYQADRVFDALDGSVRRLELTEIGTEDAETFLPMEKF